MGNIINTAPCRFCGQMVQIDSEEKLTQPQAEEQATMSCTCEQAVEYQKEKQRKEKAMQNVAALFGEAAAPEKRCSEGIVNILILTELTCKSKYQIIGILLRNGEKVPKSIANQLYKRLDALDAQIFECEMEYKEIVTALTGENRRKEHGNRIQRHGRTEQEQQGRS